MTGLSRAVVARDPAEPHRVSTPLELFFDLTSVVAIALAAEGLHHELAAGHVAEGVLAFVMVFFAIWWAWMNFTWFASAWDNDDPVHRGTALIQVAGALLLAAGVPRVFDGDGFAVVTFGYLLMRVGLIAAWMRVAASSIDARRSAGRHGGGLALLQGGWLVLLVAPPAAALPGFALLVVLELALPQWAERGRPAGWHPHHIAERYGLFTIIVLGEVILGATIGVSAALQDGAPLASLAGTVGGGLLVVFAMWWFYFDQPAHAVAARAHAHSRRRFNLALTWGYGHYAVFAAAAATGAGLLVTLDQTTGHGSLSRVAAALCLTVPVAAYLLTVWTLHASEHPAGPRQVKPYLVPALILACSWAPQPVLAAGVVLTAAIALRATAPSTRPILTRSAP